MKEEPTKPNNNADLLQPLSSEQDEVTTRSHLTRALTKKAKRNIIILITGAIALITLGILVGPSLLVQFSILLEKEPAKSQTDQATEQVLYIAPPVLNPLPSATNSAQFEISGIADSANKVKIYRNGKIVASPMVQSNGSFEAVITLTEGANQIKAKSLHSGGNESSFSQTATITYSKTAPEVSIISPSDGDTFEKDDNPITIEGTSKNASRITVNGFQAIISSNGDFSYNLPLKNGNNEIVVLALDEAGNKTEKKINVHFSE